MNQFNITEKHTTQEILLQSKGGSCMLTSQKRLHHLPIVVSPALQKLYLSVCVLGAATAPNFTKFNQPFSQKKKEFSQPMAGPSEIQVWKGDQTALNESAMTPWHV
jgi:hypothetical protein